MRMTSPTGTVVSVGEAQAERLTAKGWKADGGDAKPAKQAPPPDDAEPDEPDTPDGGQAAAERAPAGVTTLASLTVPEGNASAVLAWVGDDPARASAALDAERAKGDEARSTLVAKLTKLAGQ